ncbi:hypothetical protein [Actinomycetospora sp. NBRC 106375]|uniref:hypothetical protein n=1 Tax=Actinomycetospora sp. NBRC 106375 TaxID=3032207 RepID=UPI0025521926|nr:hypothetical protein [Actinomycetospora sp. NBRC 106375]
MAAGMALLLVAATVTVLAVRIGRTSGPPAATPSVAAGPTTTSGALDSPTSPPDAPVPVGGVLFSFTGSPNGQAHVDADGAVVAVLDEVSTAPGRSSHQLVTYDQATGARLATAGPGLPEIVDCGATVVRRPDGTSVVLTRYDTEVPANGVELGRREAHVAARDGRTLRPLWDVVLHSGDTTDQTLLIDTVCHTATPAFFPTTDGRYVLNRSFDVSRLIDLSTGGMRPVPYAVNVVGNNVVVAVPPPSEPGVDTRPDPTGPSTFDGVRLVADTDLRVLSTIPVSDTDTNDVARALAAVGRPGRPTLDGFASTGSDTRYTGKSLSSDALTLALRGSEQVSLIDLPSGRVRATIPTGSITNYAVLDPTSRPLGIVPGAVLGQDAVLVATPRRDSSSTQQNVFTAYDLTGRQLWSLPAGAADGICAIDRGVLLLQAAGLASVDPVSGRQLSVDRNATCPVVTAGLAVTSTQGSTVSTSAQYSVTVLKRP